MMKQYWAVRETLPRDALLLFRLGDFYELFDDQAREGSRILGITLTARQGIPMAGIPVKAADAYIASILEAGLKVAICEQTSTPKAGTQLVERGVTRILSPGTDLEDSRLKASDHQYLFSLLKSPKNEFHAAWMDISTGDLMLACHDDPEALLSLVHSIEPKEWIFPCGQFEDIHFKESWAQQLKTYMEGCSVNHLPMYQFDVKEGFRSVCQAMGVLVLEGFGIEANHPTLGPAGALLHYVTQHLCGPIGNLKRVELKQANNLLQIDNHTLASLDIFPNKMSPGTSLLEAMDKTVTKAGARLLKSYLSFPSRDLALIQERQACVAEAVGLGDRAEPIRERLSGIRDLERILGRLQNKLRSPRELGAIRDTLIELPELVQQFESSALPKLSAIAARIPHFEALSKYLNASLNETLPANLSDGGVFKDAYDADLDHFRMLSKGAKVWIEQFEQAEQQRSGIRNLRIKYNNAFGYFIEVTKSQISRVPQDYIRRQTTTQAERYVTDALKAKEHEVLRAQESALEREQALFSACIERVLTERQGLYQAAQALAQLDVLLGWGVIARKWNYCQPQWHAQAGIEIESGRHPVLEQRIAAGKLENTEDLESFTPNDTHLASNQHQIHLITGPNMAGKSTYIRQVALISLMAQVGSWVPASRCKLGPWSRIFSRIGASDAIARGQSTFMVEMSETANILNHMDADSLIILDEIGRGTSTYDGLSLAWAIIEHIHGANTEEGPCTLFATHYHELTQLERSLTRLKNFSMAVKENLNEILFLRKVIEGAADRSYGIHVARLAGIPAPVIERAEAVLSKLETSATVKPRKVLKEDTDAQLTFF